MMEGLSTKEIYEIDFGAELADNEYITEIKLEFGTVDVGFCSNENPHIFANIRSNVKSETVIENVAKVIGNFDKYDIIKKSRWETFAYKPLPNTGF